MAGLSSNVVIFTDLDGTLLDPQTYSYEVVLPGVNQLRQKEIPLVFCSAKTRSEQEVYRKELSIDSPFIVENGGAIFIPQGYFSFHFDYHKTRGSYVIIELGMPYQEIRQMLQRVRADTGVDFKGFGDMDVEEVMAVTGLERGAARRAKEREYDETLVLKGNPEYVETVLEVISRAGLKCTHGGRFYNVMGGNDKGKAAQILIELFRRELGQVRTVGIGDSQNDVPMLSIVDMPIMVQKPGGRWEEVDIPHLYRVEGVGPEGWMKAVREIMG